MLTIVVKEGAAFCIGPDVTIRFVRDGRKRLRVQIAAQGSQDLSAGVHHVREHVRGSEWAL